MKILYITTIGTTMNFFVSLIKQLIGDGNTVDIATNVDIGDVNEIYKKMGCKIFKLSCTRSPLEINAVKKTIKQIKKIVTKNSYDIVHCHTPVAGICTRLACRKLRKNEIKVIYTAHGFHFYKGAPIKNWLLYFPAEWICSFMTDVLITINKEDYVFAKKHLHAKKTEYVPGVGINIVKFRETEVDRKKMRKHLGIPDNAKVLLSVGELNENKNHITVIRALANIKDKNIHYLIVGEGKLRDNLSREAYELDIENQIHFVGFRDDVQGIFKISDLYIHPSKREGLPVALMEAMASGLPCVASDIRGNKDLLRKEQLFDPLNVEQIINHIYLFFIKNHEYAADKNTMSKYSVSSINDKMKTIYSGLH